MIELSTKDYPGFASAALDFGVPGRDGKPSGLFNRRADVFMGDHHVNLNHYEWGIELHGGPSLKAAYLEARPSFGAYRDNSFKPEVFVRFIEQQIRHHVCKNSKAFMTVLRGAFEAGEKSGREDAKATMREALGVALGYGQ